MGKKNKQPKKSCCGKFKKSCKYCSRCPVLVRLKCERVSADKDKSAQSKKKAKKKKK